MVTRGAFVVYDDQMNESHVGHRRRQYPVSKYKVIMKWKMKKKKNDRERLHENC